MMIDEGTRLAAVWYHGDIHIRRPEDFRRAISVGWLQHYPKPAVIRCDVEGCHTAEDNKPWLTDLSAYLDVIPGEAHRQMGLAERTIGIFKSLLDRMAQSVDPACTPEEMGALAVAAMNDLGRFNGHSPFSAAFGSSPGYSLNEFAASHPSAVDAEARRQEARKAMLEVQANSALTAAARARSRTHQEWREGEIIYYWRTRSLQECFIKRVY